LFGGTGHCKLVIEVAAAFSTKFANNGRLTMFIKKSITTTISTILVSVLLVSGCSTASKPENSGSQESMAPAASSVAAPEVTAAPKGEPVEIRINMAGDGEISKDQIAEFNKDHPDIHLSLVVADTNKLMTMIAANNSPDIIRVDGAKQLPSYVIRGLALDLQPYFDASPVFKKDDLASIADIYRFDGKTQGVGDIYGFPKDYSPDFTIFINKKLFDEAGVAVPSTTVPLTWAELLGLAKKLTKNDGKTTTQYGLAYVFGNVGLDQDILAVQLAESGKQVYTSDGNGVDLSAPEVIDSINMWTKAVKDDIVPSPLHPTEWGGSLFSAGKAAMVISGYWYSGLLRGDAAAKTHLDDFIMLPTPVMTPGGTRIASTKSGTGGIIYSKTKHPNEAFTVFEWFFGGKPADDRAKGGWGLPGFKSKMALLPVATNFDKQTYAVVQNELNYFKVIPYNAFSTVAADALFDKNLTPVFFGKDTAEGAVTKLTKDINDAIADGKDVAGVK
jgi:multiple sugar transport system substrate-binding protein